MDTQTGTDIKTRACAHTHTTEKQGHKQQCSSTQKCNTQPCVGDEICIASQDLIIAKDGSGSLREGGFNSLKKYAFDLLSRCHSPYLGARAMKNWLMEFDNGIIAPGGVTVLPAMKAHISTASWNAVKGALESKVQKKGFTRMAQAFALTETMYFVAGRARSTVHSPRDR